MKYDFLIKEKFKNSSDKVDKNSSDEVDKNIKQNKDISFIGSTMLSTYEDFNIFLKKPQDKNTHSKIIEYKEKNIDNNQSKENKTIEKKEITHDKHSKDNSTLFESEKKTVESIVKYSSSFLNLLLNFIYMLKNAFIYLISKKKLNTNTIKDKDIINRFNKHIDKNDKHIENNDKYMERNHKHMKRNHKHIEKNDKHIKKMNSYLLELE